MWDLGGQENLRYAWDAYYQGADAIVYVIDSADDSQMQDSKAEFANVLNHNELREAVILVFANKADMPTARNIEDLIEIYEFNEITSHEWKV